MKTKGFQTCVSSRPELEMTDLEALVVAAYVFADEYRVPARSGRPPLTSDAELVALTVLQAAIGVSPTGSFSGWLAACCWAGFRICPTSRRQPALALVGLISIVQQQLARWLDVGASGSPTAPSWRSPAMPAASSDPSWPASLARATRSRSIASSGACGLCCDRPAWPAARLHARAGRREGVRVARRSDRHARRGCDCPWGRRYQAQLAADEIRLLTPDRTRTAANSGGERAHASLRL
jgi:hypothetical protein